MANQDIPSRLSWTKHQAKVLNNAKENSAGKRSGDLSKYILLI